MKSLELEYKNMINQEVPDLWARIESALPDKVLDGGKATDTREDIDTKSDIAVDEAMTDNEATTLYSSQLGSENVVDITMAADTSRANRQRWNKVKRTMTIISVAAACVVGAASLVLLSRFASKDAASTATADMYSAEAVMEAANSEESLGYSRTKNDDHTRDEVIGGSMAASDEASDACLDFGSEDIDAIEDDDAEYAEATAPAVNVTTQSGFDSAFANMIGASDAATTSDSQDAEGSISENSVSENSVSANEVEDSSVKEGRKN